MKRVARFAAAFTVVWALFSLASQPAGSLAASIEIEENLDGYRAAAEKGDREAQYKMGRVYFDGYHKGIPQDYAKALEWFTKAGEQGHVDAQIKVGVLYYNGQGAAQDYAKAAEWFRKAADQGNAAAQENMGILYRNGWGVPKDPAQAAEWFRKAAEGGNASAQDTLGAMLREGEGIPKDEAQAFEWFRKSAEQGNSGGQLDLAVMYYNGQGVAQDKARAAEWFRKSAEQGNRLAQYNMGILCEDGNEGVPKDETQALDWYEKSAEQGFEKALKKVEELKNRGVMSPRAFIDLCGIGDLSAIKKALDAGMDVNIRTEGGNFATPLEAALGSALSSGNAEVLRLLVERGADASYQRDKFLMALFDPEEELYKNVTGEIVTLLVRAGASPNPELDGDGTTLLMGIVQVEHARAPELVEFLLDAGADAAAKDQEGKTALDYALENGVLDGTKALERLKEASGWKEPVQPPATPPQPPITPPQPPITEKPPIIPPMPQPPIPQQVSLDGVWGAMVNGQQWVMQYQGNQYQGWINGMPAEAGIFQIQGNMMVGRTTTGMAFSNFFQMDPSGSMFQITAPNGFSIVYQRMQ
ncbi:MAG: hypothetical protein LBR61_09955 [Synergistaceae bacterium]|jgi:TPR repeat protein|nr:hypothetical protein [Synergistaceae bacterium]